MEALFSVREARRLALAGTPLSRHAERKLAAKEIALVGSADVVLAVNEAEAKVIRGSVNADVRVLGHTIDRKATSTPFRRVPIFFLSAHCMMIFRPMSIR